MIRLATILLLGIGLTLGATLRSPKDQASQSAIAAASPAVPATRLLSWDYGTNRGEVFEVWRCAPTYAFKVTDMGSNVTRLFTNRLGAVKTNSFRYVTNRLAFLTNWTCFGETPYQLFAFSPTGESGFFRVRARNTNTGLYSGWNVK